MHNKTVLRDDDRWKRGEERPAQGKLRCWYIMEIRRGQSGYYVFLVIYIRFLSTSSSGHLRHRRNTGSKACGAQRRGRGPPSPLQTIPFSFPWTWTNTNTWDRFLSLSLSFWEKWRGRRLPPHFFKLTTPLGRNFFSAFYTANLLPLPPHKCNENSSFERGKLDNRGNFCWFSL